MILKVYQMFDCDIKKDKDGINQLPHLLNNGCIIVGINQKTNRENLDFI